MNITIAGWSALAVIILCFVIGCVRGLIKELLSLAGIFLVLAIVWYAQPYVSSFLKENTPLYGQLEKGCSHFIETVGEEMNAGPLSSADQKTVLEQIPVPELFRTQLAENNTAKVYQELGVSNFADYVTAFLTRKIYSILTLVLTWVLAAVCVKALEVLLDLLAHLPVIRSVNRLAGGMLGIGRGVLIVWLLLLILTVFYRTSWGRNGLDLVEQDTILSMFYEKTIPF